MSKVPVIESSALGGTSAFLRVPGQKPTAAPYLDNDQLRLQLAEFLCSLNHKMAPRDSITIDYNCDMSRGKFGDVRKGTFKGYSGTMAIKELRPGGDTNDRLHVEVAFARELKVWEQLSHPNLLSLVTFHINSEKGILLFVSPYTEAGNVSKYLEANNVDGSTRLQLSLDTANGLAYLHQKGVCHGDLKGANVLIYLENGRPSARLCDFGLSKIAEGPSGLTTTSFNKKGTLRWFSPELMCDAPKRTLMSDVWAWGCVVLEITTNLLPHSSATEDIGVTIRLIQKVHPANESQLPEHDGMRKVLTECWNIDPTKRPCIEECRDTLANFVIAIGVSGDLSLGVEQQAMDS